MRQISIYSTRRISTLIYGCIIHIEQAKCYDTYAGTSFGGVITQVLANANIGGYDGQVTSSQSLLLSKVAHRELIGHLQPIRVERLPSTPTPPSEYYWLVQTP